MSPATRPGCGPTRLALVAHLKSVSIEPNRRAPKQMDLLLGIIAWLLTLAIAAIFWLFSKKIHFDVIEEMPVFFIVMIPNRSSLGHHGLHAG